MINARAPVTGSEEADDREARPGLTTGPDVLQDFFFFCCFSPTDFTLPSTIISTLVWSFECEPDHHRREEGSGIREA